MNRPILLLLALLVLAAASTVDVRPARADDGWGWSKLNPFAKKEPKTDAKRVRASYNDRVADARTRTELIRKGEEPSTWEKMNQGTKSFFGKTKSVLMPWTNTREEFQPNQREILHFHLLAAVREGGTSASQDGPGFS